MSDPLTVDVAHLGFVVAQIAFLPACSTAESKVEQPADEIIIKTAGSRYQDLPM